MASRLVIVGVLAVVSLGCIDQSRINATCTWSDSVSGPLNLSTRVGRSHLRRDAEVLNELMVRYGDAHGRARPDMQRPYRQHCTQALTDTLIARHGVTLAQIRSAERDRVWWADVLFVFLPVALFGVAGTVYATRLVCGGFDSESRGIAAVMVGVVALAVSGVTLGVANFWSFGVESWRLYNGHVSNRAFLIPIATHTAACAVVAFALCIGTAFVRFRRTSLGGNAPAGYTGLRLGQLTRKPALERPRQA
jgi:hypothetical protein